MKLNLKRWLYGVLVSCVIITGLKATATSAKTKNPQVFRDGQTVVFLGDSITHGGFYEYYVSLFYSTRFPKRKIKIINAGIAGASAIGSSNRIDYDVLRHKPDLVYIMFGMNDVGRGYYKSNPPNKEIKKSRQKRLDTYKKYQAKNMQKIRKSGAHSVIITPSPYDQYSVMAKGENLTVCNEGLAECAKICRILAHENDSAVAELYTPLTELLKSHPKFKWAPDRVHPGRVGHMLMAYYILKAQNVSPIVAKLYINGRSCKVKKTENCSVSHLKKENNYISFIFKPEALPFPSSSVYKSAAKLVAINELNKEILKVSDLTPGTYELKENGMLLACFSADELAAGVHLEQLPTAGQEQAKKLEEAIMQRSQIERKIRKLVQVNTILSRAKIDYNDVKASDKYLDKWLKKVNKKYLKYYKYTVKTYRKLRENKDVILKELAKNQQDIYSLQVVPISKIELFPVKK